MPVPDAEGDRPVDLDALLAAAWRRRAPLHALAQAADPAEVIDCYRLFHGWQEGLSGLEIDRYGDTAVIAYKPQVETRASIDAIVACLDRLHAFDSVIAKPRRGSPFAVRGELPSEPITVRERGLRFAIEPAQPRNPGLYLDARPARAWIRQHSRDRRVLNLFAFTGSLGVAAAAGGARSVTHVDSQRGALARCRANHILNNLRIDDRDLVRVNIYQHLRKAATRRRQFDAIILDAPPYSELSAHSDRTPGAHGLDALVELTKPLLAPGGWLLVFFHHSESTRQWDLETLWRGESDLDFPEADPLNKLRLTALQQRGQAPV